MLEVKRNPYGNPPDFTEKMRNAEVLDLIFQDTGIDYYLFFSPSCGIDSEFYPSDIPATVYENRPSEVMMHIFPFSASDQLSCLTGNQLIRQVSCAFDKVDPDVRSENLRFFSAHFASGFSVTGRIRFRVCSAVLFSCFLLSSVFAFCQDPAPSAVPVHTSEKTEKADVEAKKEPSVIHGAIKQISHTISPETAAYDDCNFTLLIEETGSDNSYYVKVPMFVKRSYTAFSGKKAGDEIIIRIIPYEETSEAIQEIQTIDDINDFEKQMYYADAIIEDSISKGALTIDSKKKEAWLNTLIKETELQLSEYGKHIQENKEEREKEKNELKNVSFKAIQKSYGYFVLPNFYIETSHYNPTFLQGIIDLSDKCKSFGCELIVVPCVALQEYSEKELMSTFKDIPFLDYGREKFVYDCLKNGVLAVDTSSLIRSHQSAEYLPYSLLGDNHYSFVTNLFIADEIVSNLGIKRNNYTINKNYFSLNSMHIPHYSGPSWVMTEPVFETTSNTQSSDKPSILIAGDSFTTTNYFHSYLSSLALCDVQTVRHDARANTTLYELLEGKYDSVLKDAAALVFIFCAPYMKMNYPTKDLVEMTSMIKQNKELSYNVPIADASKSVTVVRPESFSASKALKAIVDITPVVSKFFVFVNSRQVFDYDCDFRYNGGDNRFVLQIEPDDFKDGKVELQIDGNASFKTIILVDPSSKD
jgi:hypothetical protein